MKHIVFFFVACLYLGFGVSFLYVKYNVSILSLVDGWLKTHCIYSSNECVFSRPQGAAVSLLRTQTWSNHMNECMVHQTCFQRSLFSGFVTDKNLFDG